MTMLAVSALSPNATAVCFFIAFVLALLAAFGAKVWPTVNILALAFAAYVFVFLWNALAG